MNDVDKFCMTIRIVNQNEKKRTNLRNNQKKRIQ